MRAEFTIDLDHLRAKDGPGAHVMHVDRHHASKPHDHVFHEIVLIDSGAAHHHSCTGIGPLEPGDLIVMRPHVWHAYVEPRNLTLFNCLIDSRLMQQFGSVLSSIDGAFDLFQRRVPRVQTQAPVVLKLSPSQHQFFSARLRQVVDEQVSKKAGWQTLVRSCAMDLLVVAARLYEPTEPSPLGPQAQRSEQAVLEVARYLETRYDQRINLSDLAQRVHLSPAHLSRCFSKRMGMGVVDFMHRLRVEEACRLLCWTEQSISDIAMQVGYDEIAYFSRCFRRHMGRSPRQYRTRESGAA